uniref:SAP domain-containing protein n=1 Tax=viral metagenome TaxID=1070528 RepID=A0A6C0KTU9_9ZZZZ
MDFTREELQKKSISALKTIAKKFHIQKYNEFKAGKENEAVEKILLFQRNLTGKTPKKERSPIRISKEEIEHMSLKQLKELLVKCGKPTSGNKEVLVKRVYDHCKINLIAKLSEELSEAKEKTPVQQTPPVVVFPRSPPRASSSCAYKTKADLKNILDAKGITHYRSILSREKLVELDSATRCDPENNVYCADPNQVCDIRDKVCTAKENMTSRDVIETDINGHRIYGNEVLIQEIKQKLGLIPSTCAFEWKKTNRRMTKCAGPEFKWVPKQGCFKKVLADPEPECPKSSPTLLFVASPNSMSLSPNSMPLSPVGGNQLVSSPLLSPVQAASLQVSPSASSGFLALSASQPTVYVNPSTIASSGPSLQSLLSSIGMGSAAASKTQSPTKLAVPKFTPPPVRSKSPSPVYNPQSPVYNPESPVYPVYNPQSPVYNPESPVYPVYNPQSPVYNPQSPVYNPQSPVYNTVSPVHSAVPQFTQPRVPLPVNVVIPQNVVAPIQIASPSGAYASPGAINISGARGAGRFLLPQRSRASGFDVFF